MSNLAEALEVALDRREYPRVPLVLRAKLVIPANGQNLPTQVTNLSAGGAGLRFSDKPPPPEMVGILAIDGFGDFDGITTRRQGNEGGLRFLIGEAERHHLRERLTTLVASGLNSVRFHREEGQWSQTPLLTLTRQNGKRLECRVDDISLQGVALVANTAIPQGEYVIFGQMIGRVVSAMQDRVMVQFLRCREAGAASL